MRIPALLALLCVTPALAVATPEGSRDVARVLHGAPQAPVGTVAVIDGGITPTAAQAAGVSVTQRLRVGGAPSGPVRTHAQGVAAALGQMCPGCRVLDVAVTRSRQGEVIARDEDLARAIRVAAARGAQTIVVSMGYAGRCTPVVAAAVRAAQRRALIIAAAGNDATARQLPCPTRMAGVVAVGGLNEEGEPAPYASLRARPALWALGAVGEAAGSSFAAPRVAGVAATLSGSPAQRRAALYAAAQIIDGRRVLRVPGDVTTQAMISGTTLRARLAPGATLTACVSPGAPYPLLWRAGGSTPLAPGEIAVTAGAQPEFIRISGDPGVRMGPCGAM